MNISCCFSEEKYKVKTVFADIDFTNCKDIYDQIEAEIGDREIGVLGKFST